MHRNYMADMAMHTVNNTSRYNGGVEIKKRFSELMEIKPEETRTAEEIITNLKNKLNGEKDESI